MMEVQPAHRYAIYFVPPPDSPLQRFGSAWLGRDSWTGAELGAPVWNGLAPEHWRQLTSAPKLYGFHATLKAPFRLAADSSPQDLIAALEEFAAEREPFESSLLKVGRISNFVALLLREPDSSLSALADACVYSFERFRAPLDSAELARRQRAPLTPRQQELLALWGYPYVFEEWRFHMTLASGVARDDATDILCRLLDVLAASCCESPLLVDAVCLAVQPGPETPFRVTRRFPLGGGRT